MAALRHQPKHVLRDILHDLQAKHQPLLQSSGSRSPVPQLINLLKDRRTEVPSRQFLRFLFSHNSARDLDLRGVLRMPAIYSLHPNPPTAAAIMVSDHFSPQVQSLLFNYTAVSRDIDIQAALQDTLDDRRCRTTLLPLHIDDLSPEGHVCTFDLSRLRWPYLQPFAAKGKKYRLPARSQVVEEELQEGLNQYLTWALKRVKEQEEAQKYYEWEDAVHKECMRRWRAAQLAAEATQGPEGYPGLRAALKEAKSSLVFVPNDRAPHGIYAICKRLYAQALAR
jgi:hypothetical protein